MSAGDSMEEEGKIFHYLKREGILWNGEPAKGSLVREQNPVKGDLKAYLLTGIHTGLKESFPRSQLRFISEKNR